ncbi:MAG: GMP synthase [Euryarchaeota archaeon]|nr:GMP synthase [Euryarchaeota archaeon]
MGDDQVVIDVIDNGGQWTHREWRMLRYLGVETQILPNNTPIEELRELDGLILSGGAARVGLTGELGNCADYLSLDVPILGICAGHQFMARHYGGDAGEAPKPEFGAAKISLVGDGGPLFEGTPSEQTVWESHNDEVTVTPPGFIAVAQSESCKVQAMQNEDLNRFGLQFHPEVNDTEYGSNIFENFVSLCKSSKSA